MRGWCAGLLFAALLHSGADAADCDRHDTADEAGVRAAEARWVAMLETRDVAGLACLLAPEFVDTNWTGRIVTRDSVLAALPGRRSGKLALSDLSVMLRGNVALVHGLNRQSDGAGKIVGAVRFTDVFLYRDGRWQAISAQETPTAGD